MDVKKKRITTKSIVMEILKKINNIDKKVDLIDRKIKNINKYIDKEKNSKYRW